MLYIVDYHVAAQTFDILDTDDNTVQSIRKNDFEKHYSKIKHLVKNKFYSSFLNCFEVYDRNNLNKKPALSVLLESMNVYDFKTLLLNATNFDCIYKLPNAYAYSFSFCKNIREERCFNLWYNHLEHFVEMISRPCIEAPLSYSKANIGFCYYRDLILSSSPVYYEHIDNPFLGENEAVSIKEEIDGYTLEFRNDLDARFFFFALEYCRTYDNIKVLKDSAITAMSPALGSAMSELGDLKADKVKGRFLTVECDNVKSVTWLTKNFVLNR